MSNEDELVKTLIKKTKNQNQNQKQKNPNNEKQQINKVVIDYDRVVIALPHFPKPPKIRINGPKTLPDHTPIAAIKGLLDEIKSKKKKKKIKSDGFDERNETQMGNGVCSNGVGEFDGLNEGKCGLSDGKDGRFEGKKKKKKESLGERNESQMGNGDCSNGVDDFEGLIDGKDGRFEGKKKKKKDNLGERNETQMGNGVCSNGVDEFEGLNKGKTGLSDGKDVNFEGKKKRKKENLDKRNVGKGVCSNGVDDFEGLNKVVKRKRGSSKDESVECRFPVNRIVRIIKSQGDDYKLGHEAVFLINKATEKFIELFSEDAYDCALEDKKSFVGYRNLSSAVGKEKRLDFLSDYVPEKMTAEKALATRKAAETSPS